MESGGEKLTPEQRHVLKERGTEPPFSGKLLHEKRDGMFVCVQCGNQLFDSGTKLEPGTEPLGLQGWPSFDEAIPGAVEYKEDNSFGMHRTEVVCAKCGGHLGHVFDDKKEKTGKHYCVNSCALDFSPEDGDTMK